MANDCLVKTFKGSTDNSNLPKLGVIKGGFKVTTSGNDLVLQSNQGCRPVSGKTIEVTILDSNVNITGVLNGATMIDSKHGILTYSYNSSLIISGANADDYVNVEFKQKYDVGLIKIAFIGSLSEFKFLNENLTSLQLNKSYGNSDVYGNIADLSELTNIVTINVQYFSGLYGDIASLGKLVNLTTLSFASIPSKKNKVTGTFDNFVAAQKANGRTTCTGIDIPAAQTFSLPIGNKTPIWSNPGATLHATLKWDGNKIDLFMADKQKAYVMGYTQSEIDAMTASGGVYEGYTVEKCD